MVHIRFFFRVQTSQAGPKSPKKIDPPELVLGRTYFPVTGLTKGLARDHSGLINNSEASHALFLSTDGILVSHRFTDSEASSISSWHVHRVLVS